MIAAMKRVFIMLLEREKRESLDKLRKLGVLHLEPMKGQGKEYEEIVSKKARVIEAIGILSSYKTKDKCQSCSLKNGLDLTDYILSLDSKQKEAMDNYVSITREIERIETWGDFDPNTVEFLAKKGINIRFVSIPTKRLETIPPEVNYIKVFSEKGSTRLFVLADKAVILPPDCIEFKIPEKSLSVLKEEQKKALELLDRIKADIIAKGKEASVLDMTLAILERDETFENARSGMATDDKIAWFAAWIPAKDVKKLEDESKKFAWGILIDDPLDDEMPPSKIENNSFVRIIQPVFDFLGTVPNYREYDISVWFLMFFSLFFAMIFGDGGYGTIMLLGSLAVAIKSKSQKKPVADFVKLMILMSCVTVAWGTVTGSWFGLPAEVLPPMLLKLTIYPIAGFNPDSADNIKYFCFFIGLIQMCLAHVKNIIKSFPSPKMIGDLGSFLMLAGMFNVVLGLVISSEKYPIPQYSLILIGVGFVLNFVFCNYDSSKPFFKALIGSIKGSLGNIVSMLLGVVNAFADITSYIRLWAVGLAGMAISQTVNNMAGPMFGKAIMFAVGILILIFGHGLNLVMGVLSVIVHGVRLNFLEFSTHLGMEWSGYKYDPFRNTVPIDVEQDEMERRI